MTRESGHPTGIRHAHIYAPSGMGVVGIGDLVSFTSIRDSMAFPFDVFEDDRLLFSGSAPGGPVVEPSTGALPIYTTGQTDPVEEPIIMPTPRDYTGYTDPSGMFPTYGKTVYLEDPVLAPLAISVLGILPLVRMIGGFLQSRFRSSIVPLSSSKVVQVGAGVESVDLVTPGVDIPSPSDIPPGAWLAIKEIFDLPVEVTRHFFPGAFGGNGNGIVVPSDTEGHGPIVKTWRAPEPDGVPFVLTQQGWIGAMRKNGTWTFYKPKRPMVITPGIPLDARQARKLALIYKRERKKAAKVFGLVERKPAGGSRKGPRILRTGHGDDVVVIND